MKKIYQQPRAVRLLLGDGQPIMAASEVQTTMQKMEDGGHLSKSLNIWDNE